MRTFCVRRVSTAALRSLDGKPAAHARRRQGLGVQWCRKRYRRPRTSRPRTPQPFAGHGRVPATLRPYCRAVGLRSLLLGTAGECVLLIWTWQPQRVRPSHLNSRTKSGTIVLKYSVLRYSLGRDDLRDEIHSANCENPACARCWSIAAICGKAASPDGFLALCSLLNFSRPTALPGGHPGLRLRGGGMADVPVLLVVEDEEPCRKSFMTP